MGEAPYALALTAGMLAAVNPCGFAMLPAYASLVVGAVGEDGADGAAVGAPSRFASLRRALAMTALMTVGFVVVFGTFGLVVTPLALSVEEWLPWVTIVIGVAMVGLGVAMVAGREITAWLPKPGRARVTGTVWSTALYGASYAVASLSCTIAPFLAVTTSTFSSSGLLAGVGVFVTYAAGMGLVVGVVTVTVALAREGAVGRLRRVLPFVGRASGVLLVVAGAYLAYYGVYEIRVFGGADASDPLIDAAGRVQGELTRIVADTGAALLASLLVVLVVAAATVTLATRRRRER